MSVALTRAVTVTAVETQDAALPTVGGQTLTHNGLNTASESFTGASETPVSVVCGVLVELSGGAASLDLTNITDELGRTIDLTGLKIQSLRAKPTSTNANPIRFKSGASSGYNLGGRSDFLWSGYATDECDFLWRDTNPDVASGAKNIDFAGTSSQSIRLQITAG